MGNKTPFISLSVVSLLGRLSSTFFSASQTFLRETCRPIDCYAKTPGRSGFETLARFPKVSVTKRARKAVRFFFIQVGGFKPIENYATRLPARE